MAEYHLDTDICSAALKGDRKVQTQCVQHFGQLRVSAVVVGELYTAAYRSQRIQDNLVALEEFLRGIEILPFNEDAARVYGQLCADLLNRGLPTGEKDAFIAAIAKSREAILVTHNTKHFENIHDLMLADWLA